MSEETPQKMHRFATKSSDFVRYLEHKTTKNDCPACGNGTWTVVCSDNGYTYRVTSVIKDGERPTMFSTFVLYCNECGFVRHHLARKVSNWVSENPEQPELDLEFGDEEGE